MIHHVNHRKSYATIYRVLHTLWNECRNAHFITMIPQPFLHCSMKNTIPGYDLHTYHTRSDANLQSDRLAKLSVQMLLCYMRDAQYVLAHNVTLILHYTCLSLELVTLLSACSMSNLTESQYSCVKVQHQSPYHDQISHERQHSTSIYSREYARISAWDVHCHA